MDPTLGTRLRTQREKKNVTLSAIAEKTKINVSLLDALERDDVSRWPFGIFRRAYIRSYAEAIELEPDPIVREFLSLYPDPREEMPAAAEAADVASDARPPTRIGLLLCQVRKLCATRLVAGESQDATQDRSSASVIRERMVAQHIAAAVSPSEAGRPEAVAAHESGGEPGRAQATTASRVRTAAMTTAPPDDTAALGRKLTSIGRLCTVLGSCRDQQEVATVLDAAARILDARGIVLWMSDSLRATLYPVLTARYAENVLKNIPPVHRNSDTAVASAFRVGQVRVVRSAGQATGALVAPLLTPVGCVGVLALEFADGAESRAGIRALVTILTAQLSTVVGVTAFVRAVSA